MLYEDPERFHDTKRNQFYGMGAPDVVAFVYQISTNALVCAKVGTRITHSTILSYIMKGDVGGMVDEGKLFQYHDFDTKAMTEANLLTGRLWINNSKVAVWDYDGDFEDDDIIRKHITTITKTLNYLIDVPVGDYEIEVTPLAFDSYDENTPDRKFNLLTNA